MHIIPCFPGDVGSDRGVFAPRNLLCFDDRPRVLIRVASVQLDVRKQ